MAHIAKKTKRYPSDLNDEEWERIAPLMPAPGQCGRPREVDFREAINAERYLVRSGSGWRMLSVHFGPWQTVYWWFRELARRFLLQTIHDIALMVDRDRAGLEASPSAAVIYSQSVNAPPHAETPGGYDAGKKIAGRKRDIAVDTDGRLLLVNLTTADICRRADDPRGDLQALAVGEASVCQWRRLVRDYEKRIDISPAMIFGAMGGNVLARQECTIKLRYQTPSRQQGLRL